MRGAAVISAASHGPRTNHSVTNSWLEWSENIGSIPKFHRHGRTLFLTWSIQPQHHGSSWPRPYTTTFFPLRFSHDGRLTGSDSLPLALDPRVSNLQDGSSHVIWRPRLMASTNPDSPILNPLTPFPAIIQSPFRSPTSSPGKYY